MLTPSLPSCERVRQSPLRPIPPSPAVSRHSPRLLPLFTVSPPSCSLAALGVLSPPATILVLLPSLRHSSFRPSHNRVSLVTLLARISSLYAPSRGPPSHSLPSHNISALPLLPSLFHLPAPTSAVTFRNLPPSYRPPLPPPSWHLLPFLRPALTALLPPSPSRQLSPTPSPRLYLLTLPTFYRACRSCADPLVVLSTISLAALLSLQMFTLYLLYTSCAVPPLVNITPVLVLLSRPACLPHRCPHFRRPLSAAAVVITVPLSSLSCSLIGDPLVLVPYNHALTSPSPSSSASISPSLLPIPAFIPLLDGSSVPQPLPSYSSCRHVRGPTLTPFFL